MLHWENLNIIVPFSSVVDHTNQKSETRNSLVKSNRNNFFKYSRVMSEKFSIFKLYVTVSSSGDWFFVLFKLVAIGQWNYFSLAAWPIQLNGSNTNLLLKRLHHAAVIGSFRSLKMPKACKR